ncbi:hypothetical protein BaRGS_00030745, partial [Batillaria attramentaria]
MKSVFPGTVERQADPVYLAKTMTQFGTKNLTFIDKMPHATVLSINSGEGEYVRMKLENAGVVVSLKADKFLQNPPRVTSLLLNDGADDQLIQQGANISLTCSLDAGNPPVYNVSFISQSGDIHSPATTEGIDSAVYTIHNVSCVDLGNVRCEVPGADVNGTTRLLVRCPPQFVTPVPIPPVTSGQDLVLQFPFRSHTSNVTTLIVPFFAVVGLASLIYVCKRKKENGREVEEECDMIENPVYGTASDFIRRSAESPYTEVKDCIRPRDASPTHSHPCTTGDRKPDGKYMDPSSTTAREDPETTSHCGTNEDGAPSPLRTTVVSE